MQYKGFYIEIKPGTILRTAPDGEKVACPGFLIEIFDVPEKSVIVDAFTAAIGYELLGDSPSEAEHLAKDYISMEEKELRKLIHEYRKFS